MKNNLSKTQKQTFLLISIAVIVLFALTICGCFWDFEISKAIYLGEQPNENIFGVVFSFIGIIPTFVGWSFLGSSILCLSKKQILTDKKRRVIIAFAILLFVLSFFYFCNTIYLSNANAFKVHFLIAYPIGIAVICAVAYIGYKLAKNSNDANLLSKLLFLSAVSLVTLLIISVTKGLALRPRFRFVIAMDNPEYFKNWWQGGRNIKNSLGANVITDEFASFPSGHSAYSMFAIFLFPTLLDFFGDCKKYKPFLFALGFIWWIATALSRLTVGAHYLTDVTIAGLVTILSYAIVFTVKSVYSKLKKQEK